ncbi:MAG: L-seryl-tRNA(Sec) selenium transferase [Candidatus Eisenbacteria bacterium]|nr:L-seryl-tRNA(Sec) selenium transferase [Candidatus Eisenbacteria bacterium]MCC7143289.1 L-seryl-tRNA(Sec) selenium transferase [Candidatus Eisenbacteria bacterium]
MSHPQNLAEFQALPAIDALLAAVDAADTPRGLLLAWAREALAEARAAILAAPTPSDLPAHGRTAWISHLAARVAERVRCDREQSLRRVINATGVLLHTNLGRAPLSADAQAALVGAAAGYSNLEMDLASGRRQSRLHAVRDLLPQVTGAEAGLPVHNNAAAVYLTLTALASGREVIVSRGHLVEIGGGFRLPDIMVASGAKLVEVGTSNRTRIRDYEAAITERTALLLKVHPSNFRIVGFFEEASTEELAALAHRHDLPLFDDLGSGALSQHGPLALGEPTVQASLAAGADLVAISGDKLLGGPQAGLLIGATRWIERLAKHPVARVVRLDKTALAALEATLRAYLDPASLATRLPLLALLARTEDDLAERAERLRERLSAALPAGRPDGSGDWSLEVITTCAEVGGGSLPGVELPSRAVAVTRSGISPNQLSDAFRRLTPPVAGRIERDRFLLDLRTLLDGDDLDIARAASALEFS